MAARVVLPRIPRVQDLASLTVMPERAVSDALSAFDRGFRALERPLFATEGQSGGGRWEPLSASYASQKRRRRPGRKILQRSGRLRRSLVQLGDEHVRESHRIGTQAALVVGTRTPYASFHHRGTPRMPKRDPIQMTREQERDLGSAAARALVPHVERAIRALMARPPQVRVV